MSLAMPLDLISWHPGQPRFRSYSRASTEKQTAGESYARQAGDGDYTDEALAKRFGLELGPPIISKPTSAYRGKNLITGEFATYLNDVIASRIPEGEIIGLDEWSRLTRMGLDKSSHLLTTLINKGVGIYVRKTDTLINRKKVRGVGGFMDLTMALMQLEFANRESETKSRYTRKTIAIRHEQAEKTGELRTGSCPGWLEESTGLTYKEAAAAGIKRDWRKLPGPVHVIKTIFPMALSLGARSLSLWLNEQWQAGDDRYAPFGLNRKSGSSGWSGASVATLLRNPAVYGLMERSAIDPETGKPVRTPERDYLYYPEIIPEKLFCDVQDAIDDRRRVNTAELGRKAGKGGRKGHNMPNLFSGLCICDLCGGPVTLYTARPGASKRLRKKRVFSYLRCRTAKIGGGCKSPAVNYEWVEGGILGILEGMSIEALSQPDTTVSEAAAEQARLVKRLAIITTKISRFAEEQDPDKAAAMEEHLVQWGAEKRQINARLAELRPIIDRENGGDSAGERLMTIKRLGPLLGGEPSPERLQARLAVHPVLLASIDVIRFRADRTCLAQMRGMPNAWIECSKAGPTTNMTGTPYFEAERAALIANAAEPEIVAAFDKGRRLVARGRMPMRRASRGR